MKVLQLCNKPPMPAVDGGCLAMLHLGNGLREQGVDLKIVSICTKKHPFRKQQVDKEYIERTKSEFIYVDTDINLVDAFSSLITKDSYNVSRFFSPDLDQRLEEILSKEKFDVIILESIFVAPYIGTIRRHSKAKLILRAHNIEYKIWRRLGKQSENKAKRIYYKHLAKRLKSFELDAFNQVDGIATISSLDEKNLRKKTDTPIINIPFGINLDEYKYAWSNSSDCFHLGSLDWKPNLEGVSWFIDEVFSRVNDDSLTFYLAGREIPNWINNCKDERIKIVGEVDSAKSFISEQGIMIVPLLSGGGMRVKIIEGLALGKVVITTSIGIEGIDAKHGKNILIADSAKDFAQQLIEISKDAEKRKEISKNARQLIEKKHTNNVIMQNLISFIEQL